MDPIHLVHQNRVNHRNHHLLRGIGNHTYISDFSIDITKEKKKSGNRIGKQKPFPINFRSITEWTERKPYNDIQIQINFVFYL